MSIYLIIVALTLILGAVMPQKGKNRIYYIVVMAVIHGFVSAFRYQYLTGDLLKYQWIYSHLYQHDWLSEEVLAEGRNSGFQMLMKFCALLFDNQFQPFLVVTSVFITIVVAVLIYRYSPQPWLSYLVWNCMGLYILGFSAVKQAVAMAVVMIAFIGIQQRRLGFYLVTMAVAGFLHTPSLIFLPAYWLAQQRVNGKMLLFYIAMGVALYVFKEQFIEFITSFYYEDDEVFVFSGEIGNRFIMLLGFTLFGVLFRGFSNRTYEQLFHLMAVATILQLLSGFDNIFTRLTDYYFQFSVLYIPMTFSYDLPRDQKARLGSVFPFNRRSTALLTVFIVAFVIWFYWTYNINITIASEVDNYLNYRFMWDVK